MDTELRDLRPVPQTADTAARRAALSARFPGERLVIPAGNLKTRSNDTESRAPRRGAPGARGVERRVFAPGLPGVEPAPRSVKHRPPRRQGPVPGARGMEPAPRSVERRVSAAWSAGPHGVRARRPVPAAWSAGSSRRVSPAWNRPRAA
ncbi:hypothetical protein [Streptomyces coeruleorubidus]|uniref:hypothetical protein n=1 Tax=Streptomyces coeruleorubidus TaxID=116188 RepID=UPI0036C11824